MAYFIILLGAVMRAVPHLPNFTPIGAIALFGGVYLNKRHALVLPVAAMVVSDFFIGFDSLASRLSVYGCFALIGLIGLLIRNRKSVATVVVGSLSGSVIFFLITNFVWLYNTSMYPHSWQGLMASYTNAIPFVRNMAMGDLFYVGILFGSFELVKYFQRLYDYKSQSSNQSKI